ncbi:MAG: hypothetical protein K2L89_06100, partial [Muribaculaceae bacterium]|nr:hypothetical protein [Muribaculaceae bacterium]
GWSDGARYAPPTDADVAVTTDQTYQMVSGSENPKTWTIGNGNWTVVVDPENMTISFDLGDSTGEANVLIDRSQDTEFAGTFESYALEEVEGDANCYKWTGSLDKGDKLKFNIHGVNYFYDPSKGNIVTEDFDADDNLSIEYALEEGEEGFVAFDYASAVTITVDVDDTKVTVDLADAPRVSMTITSGETSEIHKITQTAQGSKIYVMEHAVTLAPEDQVDFRVLANRYTVDFSQPQAAAENESNVKTYAMSLNDDDSAAPACGLTGSYIFKVDNTGAAPVLTVTPSTETGVAEIAADNAEAVYFNLQGVQIEKPENGLFIEVRGNKAAKVMVK